MIHDDIGELLGAYVLDAISTEERDEVDAHLPQCPICTQEVERLFSVTDHLALLAIERDPPPELRTRLLNLVELDRKEWERRQATQATVAPPLAGWTARLRRFLAGVPPLGYGAAGALIVAAVLLIVVLANRNNVSIITYHGGSVVAQAQGIDLRSTTITVGVRSDHQTDVAFANLPALPPDKAYELWFIPAKGQPVAVGGLIATAQHAWSGRFARDARGYLLAAVTIEHAPGDSAVPTSAVILKVPLQS